MKHPENGLHQNKGVSQETGRYGPQKKGILGMLEKGSLQEESHDKKSRGTDKFPSMINYVGNYIEELMINMRII